MARCCRWCCRWLGIHRRPDAERGLVSARGPPPAAPLPPLDDLEGAAASAAADALHSEARTPSHCFRELRRGSHTLGGSAISEQGRTPEANDTSATPEQGRTPEASDAWDQGLREAEEDAAPAGPAGAPAECGRAATPQERQSELCGVWLGPKGPPDNLEAFLKMVGAPWPARKAALALSRNFAPRLEFSCEGPKCLVAITTLFGVETEEFVLDGPPFHTTFGPRKRPGTGVASLEGGAVVMRTDLEDGMRIEKRRWREEGKLHELVTLTRGEEEVQLRRVYTSVLPE